MLFRSSMKNDHVDTEMNKATLGRMLKNMLSQLPLDGQVSNEMNEEEQIEMKLFGLMEYYNNVMNFKVFSGITAKIINQTESDCLKIV